MGLGISGFRSAIPTDAPRFNEFGEPVDVDGNIDDGFLKVEVGDWPADYIAPLVDGGWYHVGQEAAHAHFSYGGYNYFREQVAKAAMGVQPREVWNDPGRFASHPLFRLVNFSDCWGILGPEACTAIHEGLTDAADALRDEFNIDNVIACFDAGRTGLVTFS